jgi:hypothetical protein
MVRQRRYVMPRNIIDAARLRLPYTVLRGGYQDGDRRRITDKERVAEGDLGGDGEGGTFGLYVVRAADVTGGGAARRRNCNRDVA